MKSPQFFPNDDRPVYKNTVHLLSRPGILFSVFPINLKGGVVRVFIKKVLLLFQVIPVDILYFRGIFGTCLLNKKNKIPINYPDFVDRGIQSRTSSCFWVLRLYFTSRCSLSGWIYKVLSAMICESFTLDSYKGSMVCSFRSY